MNLLRNLACGARRLAIATLALAAVSGGALAQITSEQQSAIRSNCRSDFTSKCKGVTPGGKEALQCLQKNVADLAPGCKAAVSATLPAPAPVAAKPAEPPPAPAAPPPAAAPPPQAPAAAPPAAAPPPPAQPAMAPPPAAKPQQAQKPAAPPKQPAAAAAAAPKQAAAAPAAAPPPPAPLPAPAAAAPTAAPLPSDQQMKAVAFTCRREFADNCRGVKPGGAEAIDCLHRNAAKLTPDCMLSLADLGDAMPPAAGPRLPAQTRAPNAPIVMTAVIGRACMRDLLLHCRDAKVGEGRKIDCLLERGPTLAPLCRAALNITEPVR